MRIKIILFVFFIVWLTLLVRIFYLTVKSNHYYETLSHRNTIKSELITPVRGEIVDRNKRPLAINKLGFKISIAPHLRKKSKIKILTKELNNLENLIPDLNATKLLKRYVKEDSQYNHDYITLVDFIEYETVMPIYSQLNLRDYVKVESAQMRYYPNNSMAAHTIGYVSKANKKDIEDKVTKLVGHVGKSGVERYYNHFLQGEAGVKKVKVTAQNKQIEVLSYRPAVENRDLTLSLDSELQKYIQKLLKKKVGSVVVMDTNGSILALGSYPEYNLNTFVTGISTKEWKKLIQSVDTPFTNKIINGLYPPGSTVKTGLGLTFMTEGIMTQFGHSYCTGSMKLGKRNFRCWKRHGHAKTTLTKAIRESCDDYFYKGSLKLGIEKMSDGFRNFGLGQKTGVDMPNEFIGTVPSRTWKMNRYSKPWYKGETLNTSIGQGDFLVTPLQMAQFTGLMATGKLITPHIAYKLGDEFIKPEIKDILSEKEKEKLPIIQFAMHQVCSHIKGTATHFLKTKIDIAGKTGTAQVVGISQATKKRLKEHEMEYYRRSHAWLTTYGPYENPQFIVTVLIEHGGHGGTAAGGIVSKIYNKLDKLGYIKK
jgi:penicillin-binding protein 2